MVRPLTERVYNLLCHLMDNFAVFTY
ncbi:hypothetical protein TRIP_B200039 [uncultured Desulfatiglans sp.]|nr:hypothetical protein TRIP_B200039 [uncultured Desulfatiglans sp.]